MFRSWKYATVALLISNLAIADPATNPSTASAGTESTGSQSVGTQSIGADPSYIITCPATDQLIYNPAKMTWSAAEGWQSYEKSFSKQISHFNGAQWSGIKVGQVICSYTGTEKDTFPIQLIFSKLTLEPSGNLWGKNQGGYINCSSQNPNDCPFELKVEQPISDIYQEVANIKQGSVSNTDTTSGSN